MAGVWDIERVDGSDVDLFKDNEEEEVTNYEKFNYKKKKNLFDFLLPSNISIEWELFILHSQDKTKKKNKILFTQICHEDEQANKEYEDSLGFFISSTTQSDN